MSNRLPFAALAVACLAAAAAGGYIATRQNAIPAPASAQAGPAVPVAQVGQVATPSQPAVQETEATVTENARKPVAASKSAGDPVAAKRRNESARTADARTPQTPTPAPPPPPLQGTWPSSAAQVPAVPPAPTSIEPATRPDEHAQEPPHAPEPPRPTLEDLVVPRDSVIGLQTDTRVSTDTARVEDRVDAHITRDVKVGDRIAVPAGSKVIGSVTQVDRGGKFKEQARLGIRFHTIVLADGTNLQISTETIVRLGDAPGNGSAAKIGGGAVGGAILGAILGGAKGAAIGATAGAGAGTAAVTAGKGSTVVLPEGTALTPRVLSPITVTVER
ncbi:MAG TPA: TrbI/VirB10 family protein [Vicinamibacterales bacterium]